MSLGVAARALMIGTGFIPLLHVLSVLTLALWPWGAASGLRSLVALAALYLLPPLAARLGRVVLPLPDGLVGVGSRGFLAWWLSSQWQVVFNRLSLLEELLRIVPGLYSIWLRLWGARIGRLVYWAPGLRILDRSLLDVGDRVVFGAGVRIHGHLMAPDPAGVMALVVSPVFIGAEALVGAYALLSPGASIAPGEVAPALRTLGPFTEWRDGRRHVKRHRRQEPS